MKWPAIPPKMVTRELVPKSESLPWWYLGTMLFDLDTWVTWRSALWWTTRLTHARTSVLRALMHVGFWDVIVEAGDYWQDGRFRVDFWNTQRDQEARIARQMDAQEKEYQRNKAAYDDGYREGCLSGVKKVEAELERYFAMKSS